MFERRGLLQAAVCVVVTLAMVFLVASSGMAATYYVSTTGDDDNDGSWDYPWRHIAKANSTLVAGDTVYVLAGSYPEPIDAANSGNAISGYISYIGYEDDVILDGSSLGSGSGVYFWDTSYIHVENFQIHDWFREGAHALVADHIRLVDCLVDQCGKRADDWDMGVELDTVTDFVVDGCDLIDNLICGILVIESQDGRIANTWADDNNGTGRRGAREDDADGFLIQNSQHILIENCIASWNGEDGFDAGLYEDLSGDTTDIVMRDCLSYENGSAGYNMSGADDPYPYATHDIRLIRCRGYENYMYGIVWYQQATGIWVSNTTLADENGGIRDGWTPNNGFDLKFKNSNVAFHKYSKFDGEGPFLLDYNNWYESLP
ncbi:MAG TPA: right-handed parallel beta-helix repeat-containing protein, partial [Anaerolineae bacterium]|nr:right-handed parallel beta-helix repeat-containing protein [Anaerolineae bacterium]